MFLAKSKTEENGVIKQETLKQHIEYCLSVFNDLCVMHKSLIPCLKIAKHSGKQLFLIAVLLHDMGKCVRAFQEITLNSDTKEVWHYRHEILSCEFINLIKELNQEAKELLQLAILGHHNKTLEILGKAIPEEKNDAFSWFDDESEEDQEEEESKEAMYTDAKNSLEQQWDEIVNLLEELASIYKQYNNGKELALDLQYNLLESGFPLIKKYYYSVENFEQDWPYEKIMFLKGLLVHCDHLGSGHNRIAKIEDDLEQYFRNKFLLNEIQQKVLNLQDSLLIAPTGSGKTEASLIWAAKYLKQNNYSRIFYILPYTASINAMYERLNKEEFAKDKIDLLHGKALTFYYNKAIENMNEKEIEENASELNKKVFFKKLSARGIKNPIKILTPHQILKNFYGVKGFETAFIQYHNALFIFDEIHCYDKELLANLIAACSYIKNKLQGHFFIMSATFPKIMIDIFQKYLGFKEITTMSKQSLVKYTKNILELKYRSIEEYLHFIQQTINNGKKVLIICNTIKKAQEIYEKIDSDKLLLLHSSFTQKDRNAKEQLLIEWEKKDIKGVLVGTQAIEVSLDIDYDILFTELASIDALIQRFGRVYRKRDYSKTQQYGKVIVFTKIDKASEYIYNEDNFDFLGKTLDQLKKINGQAMKFEALEQAVNNVFDKDYQAVLERRIQKQLKQFGHIQFYPLKNYSDIAKSYFDQFDGIAILPKEFHEKYEELIEEKKYIEAQQYLLNITERKFFKYLNKSFLDFSEYGNRKIWRSCNDCLSYKSDIGLQIKDDQLII